MKLFFKRIDISQLYPSRHFELMGPRSGGTMSEKPFHCVHNLTGRIYT